MLARQRTYVPDGVAVTAAGVGGRGESCHRCLGAGVRSCCWLLLRMQDESHGMRRVGDCFAEGWPTACDQNFTEAALWYQRAGTLYSGHALLALSTLHRLGNGVPRNLSKVRQGRMAALPFVCDAHV